MRLIQCIVCVWIKGFLWCQRVSECQRHEYESLFAYISPVFGSEYLETVADWRPWSLNKNSCNRSIGNEPNSSGTTQFQRYLTGYPRVVFGILFCEPDSLHLGFPLHWLVSGDAHKLREKFHVSRSFRKSFQLRWTCLPTPCKSWQPQQESRVKLREETVATANKFLTTCHYVTSFWNKIHKSYTFLNCKFLDSGVPYDQESNFHVWKPVTILTKASRFAKRVKREQKTWD